MIIKTTVNKYHGGNMEEQQTLDELIQRPMTGLLLQNIPKELCTPLSASQIS